MKKFLQYFGLLLFTIFVFGLGIFAYKLSSDTLVFAFEDSKNQIGNSMVLAFDRPGTLSKMIPSGALIDAEAIKKSLLYNGNPVSLQDLEDFDFRITESYVEIIPKNPQNGDILTLSSVLYADNKKTSYQLPSDIHLEISENEEFIEIVPSKNPAEINHFSVNFPENISSKNILWYVYYPKNNEACYSDDIVWNADKFSRVNTLKDVKNENIFHLDIDSTKSICLIAGLSNQIIPVLDRKLDNFSYTASLLQVLNAEEYIQNQVEFSFSSPLLPDLEKDSDIYKKLKTEKISQIFDHLDISPNVDISEKNIDIMKDSVRIIADFQNNQKYNIHISPIIDIYGREISPKFSFTPNVSPFLSLNIDKNQQKFQNFSDISAKIFVISPEKNEYEIKLCRLDAYGFSRLNQIYNEKNKQNLEEVYELVTSSHATECQKQAIKISENSSFTSFHPSEIFDAEKIRPGFYVLLFQNIDDIKSFENFAVPFPFSLANSDIQMAFDTSARASFLVIDSLGNILPNQEIEILKKIPQENGNFSYTTGSIIGKTNEKGILLQNLQDFSDSEILVIARGNQKFGYFSHKFSEFKVVNTDFFVKFLTNGEIFYKNDTLNASIILVENGEIAKNKKVFIEFLSEKGDAIKKTTLISNEFGVIAFDFVFNEELQYGNYFLKIFHEKSDGNIENIGEKKIIFSEKEGKKYNVNAEIRFLNTENGIPRNLLEKPNTSEEFTHYKNIYSASVQAEIVARAYDENGEIIKNSPFQYKIFRKKMSQGNDKKELMKEGIAKFDGDGLGLVTESLEFETFYHDIEYSLEINVQNPKTSEFSQGFASTHLKIPDDFYTFDDSIIPDFLFQKEIFLKNETISFDFSDIIWTQLNNKKYRFDLLNSSNDVLYSADIAHQKTEIPKLPLHSGVYSVKVYPITPEGIIAPENTSVLKKFFIKSEEKTSFQNAEIFSNISTKNIENIIVSPVNSGSIMISYLHNDKVFTDYFSFSENIIPYNITLENLPEKFPFSVIIQDYEGKKYTNEKIIEIPEKNENIKIHFSRNASDKNKFSAQISLVDEKNNAIQGNAMIRIFEGNPTEKIFENIFTQKQYISMGFAGNIFEKKFEEIFGKKKVENGGKSQKNIYFSPSIMSDTNGQITIDVEDFYPKKDYYIEVFAYTDTSKIGYFIQKFENKKDFDFSIEIPDSLYVGDRSFVQFFAKNNTQTIVQAMPKIEFQHQNESIIFTGSLFLNLGKNEQIAMPIRFPDHWQGNVDYKASLEKNEEILSQSFGKIFIEAIPVMGLSHSHILSGTGKLDVKIFSDSLYDPHTSKIQIFASNSLGVIIPKYFNDIYFAPKTSKLDMLSDFYIRAKLVGNKDFSYIVNKDSLQNEMADFFIKNPKIFQENKNFSKNLENMEKMARLTNTEIFSHNNIIFEMKKYISHIMESEKLKHDENVKIFLIQTLLNEKIDEEKFSQIQLDLLSQNAFLDYLEILTLQKKEISNEIFDLYFARFYTNFEAEILPYNSKKQNVKMAKILLQNHKNEKFQEILSKLLGTSNTILSVSEMVECIDLALIHSEKNSSIIEKIALQSGIITASDELNNEKKMISWDIERSKLSDIISLSSSGKGEIFYAIFEENTLEAPSLFPSKNSDLLETTTTIEKVYEMAGFDEKGNYRALEKIHDNNLEKNALYKVTMSVKVKNTQGTKWKNLALKIFTFPGSEIFYQNKKTEKIIFEKNFHLQKIKAYNYFLQAEKEGSSGDAEFSYSYFFRPKIEGSYLLPGNFVYFIEGKEFFANSSHNYFHIQ